MQSDPAMPIKRLQRSIRSVIAPGAWLLAAVVASTPVSAQGQPAVEAQQPGSGSGVDQAREHFLRGVELYREGDFRSAIIEFERAYEVAPNYKVLYNIGQAHHELQDYAAAHVAFERFLREGGDEINPVQRKKVEDEIRKLAGRVAKARIHVDVEGATILVDDVERGTTPLAAPLTVSTGRHKITIQKPGYIPQTKSVDVAGGDDLDLDFSLAPLPKAAVEPRPSVRKSEPSRETVATQPQVERGMGTPFWVSLTATGVLAAGSGVMGVLALGAQSENDDKAEQIGVSSADLRDSKSKVQGYALATDVLAGAALVAGGLTLYFALDGDDSSSTEVGVVPGGAVLRGSF